MKLYPVEVYLYNLSMCMKGDNPGPTNIKRDNSQLFVWDDLGISFVIVCVWYLL